MNKRIIIEKADDYRKVVKNLKALRPPCHVASAVSTICFMVVWAVSRQFFKPLLDWNPIVIYTAITVISIPIALYFEKIVSGVIDAFATIFADQHGKRAVAGMGLVLAPLFFVAASTSFVGLRSTITQGSQAAVVDNLSHITKEVTSSSIALTDRLSKRENELKQQRSEMRKAIELEWNARIDSRKSQCEVEYSKNTTWLERQEKKQKCLKRMTAAAKAKKATDLRKFDEETNELLQQLSKSNAELEKKTATSTGAALEVITEQSTDAVEQVNFLGGFFGFGAVLALVISLLAAVMEKKISNVLVKKK